MKPFNILAAFISFSFAAGTVGLEFGGIAYSHAVNLKPDADFFNVFEFAIASAFLLALLVVPILIALYSRMLTAMLAFISASQFALLFLMIGMEEPTNSNVFLILNGLVYATLSFGASFGIPTPATPPAGSKGRRA